MLSDFNVNIDKLTRSNLIEIRANSLVLSAKLITFVPMFDTY